MVTYLKDENRWLKERLEDKEQQIRALMPGPGAAGNEGQRQLTRWQAFKVLVLGARAGPERQPV